MQVVTKFERNQRNSGKSLGSYQGSDPHYKGIDFSAMGATQINYWTISCLKEMVITFEKTNSKFNIYPFWVEFCKKNKELQIHVASGSHISETVSEIIFVTDIVDEINLSDGKEVQVVFKVYNYDKKNNPGDLYFKDCAGNVHQIPVYKLDKGIGEEPSDTPFSDINLKTDSKNGSIIVGI
jgi:hypothetical protein